MNIFIVGVGGIGGWLLRPVIMATRRKVDNIIIIDGDTVEHRNLDRQLFSVSDIGKSKAASAVLAVEHLGVKPKQIRSIHSYVTPGDPIPGTAGDWVLGCVDNHPSRAEILRQADWLGFNAILGGNSEWSYSACLYRPQWKDSARDPRVMYPEILTDQTNAPSESLVSCAVRADIGGSPQTVHANMAAASSILYLLMTRLSGMTGENIAENEQLDSLYPHAVEATITSVNLRKNERASLVPPNASASV